MLRRCRQGRAPLCTIPQAGRGCAAAADVEDTTAPEVVNAGAAPGTSHNSGIFRVLRSGPVRGFSHSNGRRRSHERDSNLGWRSSCFVTIGGYWSFVFSNPVDNSYSVVMTAQDAVGNVSDPVTVKVVVTYCLI